MNAEKPESPKNPYKCQQPSNPCLGSLRKTIYESSKECKQAAFWKCPKRLDKTKKNLKKLEERFCEKGEMGISRMTKRRLCSYITTNPAYKYEKKALKKNWGQAPNTIGPAIQHFFTPKPVKEYQGGHISDAARILYLLRYMKGNLALFTVKGDITSSKLLWSNEDPETDEIMKQAKLYMDDSLVSFLRKHRTKDFVFANMRLYMRHEDKTSSVHANFLMFDMKNKLVYRYEPSGIGPLYDVFDMDGLDVALQKWGRDHKWKYMAPWESCPRQAIGKVAQEQRLAQQKEKSEKDPGGFCKVWALFMMEQKMRNPHLSFEQLHDQTVAYFKETNISMYEFGKYFTARVFTAADELLAKHGYTPEKGTPEDYLEKHWVALLKLAIQ
jgi:hypothetical protein